MKRSLIALLLTMTLMVAAGCGGRNVPLNPAPSSPAATGRAEIGTDSNGNTTIDLKVQHVANPENLTPPKTLYVVWLQPRGEPVQNLGQLKVNENLEGEFKATSPYKDFELFVTAETDPRATTPTGMEIMRQAVTR